MLFRTLRALIDKGLTADLEQKIDVFYAAGKLTENEYSQLCDLLKGKGE